MVAPDLGTEILLRSGRVDRLLLGDPWEASFVAGGGAARRCAPAVDALRPGDRMLLDAAGRHVLAALRAHPARDLLARPPPGARAAAAVGAAADRPAVPAAARRPRARAASRSWSCVPRR